MKSPSSPRRSKKWLRQASETEPELSVEALEPRILFSGTPAPVEAPSPEAESEAEPEVAQTAGAGDEQTPPSEEITALSRDAASVDAPQSASPEDPEASGNLSTLELGYEASHGESSIPAEQQVAITATGEYLALNQETLERLAEAAEERWRDTGLSQEQEDALSSIHYSLADLNPLYVGAVQGDRISIDADGNGFSWFIDETPLLDEEFEADGSRLVATVGSAAQHLDLLSVLMHEQGHVMGLRDVYGTAMTGGVMDGAIETGERRLPEAREASDATPGTLEGVHHLSPLVTTFSDGIGIGSLRDAIIASNASADASDTINLSAGTYTLSLAGTGENSAATGDLDITKSNGTLSIIGQGVGATTIDADSIDRVFEIFGGADVTFQDLTLTGGLASGSEDGGGFRVLGNASVRLVNVLIDGNAADEGGGFYVTGGGGATVDLSNTTVSNNTANTRGGGFRNAGVDTVVTISGGSIDTNTANNEHGGGFYNNGRVVLTDVDITGNQVLDLDNTNGRADDSHGGGFFNNVANTGVPLAGQVEIIGGSITDNTAYGHGGGFWNRGGNVTITGTSGDHVEIYRNVAGAAGTAAATRSGGGFWATDAAQTTLEFVDFSDGTNATANRVTSVGMTDADNDLRGVGAGFYNSSQSTAILSDVALTHHRADQGGAFYQDGTGSSVIGTRVTLDDNYARTRGGAFRNATTGGEVELTDSSIDSNTVRNEHGGGFHNSGTVTLFNTDVSNNIALDQDGSNRRDSHGGGFFNSSGTVNLRAGSDILSNSTWGQGGGFWNSGGLVDAEDSLIDGNFTIYFNSDRPGGGFWNSGDATANLTNVTISNNFTGADGSSVIQGAGGGFYNNDGSTVTIDGNSQIVGNRAEDGGGFYNTSTGGLVTITGTDGNRIEIDNNYARSNGGGFRSTGSTTVDLTYVDIVNNVADNARGGGFYTDGGAIEGDFVRIDNNETDAAMDGGNEEGGGFWVSSNGSVTLRDSEVTENHGRGNGGGFFVDSGTVNLLRSLVDRNQTNDSGGGFFANNSANVTLNDSTVRSNIAQNNGGGFWSEDDATLTIERSLITDNLAGYDFDGSTVTDTAADGGGFNARSRSRVTVVDSAIERNEAAGDGGGIYMEDETQLSVRGSTIADNVSGSWGGGVDLRDLMRASFVNSTISGNVAGYRQAEAGGTITFGPAGTTPSNTSARGGGVYINSSGVVAHFNHVTVADNHATGNGGGIYRNQSPAVTLENSIVVDNYRNVDTGASRSDTRNAIELVGANVIRQHRSTALTGDTGAGFLFTGGANDPSIAALANNGGATLPDGTSPRTHAITSTSVAAGIAINSTVAVDQIGVGRFDASGGATAASVGAYEANPVGETLTLDSIRVPETVLSGQTFEVEASATSTGAGPLSYTWTLEAPTGGTGDSDTGAAVSLTATVPEADPVQSVKLTLVVSDASTGQSVIEVREVRVLDPTVCPDSGTSGIVGSSLVNTATDVVDPFDGFTSLREAIDAANSSGDGTYVIEIAAGIDPIMSVVSSGNENGNVDGDFDITKTNGVVSIVGLTVGPGGNTIDGNLVDRVFNVLPGAATYFCNLTITGGQTVSASDDGGGVRIDGAVAVFDNVDIVSNAAVSTNSDGGGLYMASSGIRSSVVYMTNGSISNNVSGDHGGGVYMAGTNVGESLLWMDGTTVSSNQASTARTDRDGGGLYITDDGNRVVMNNVVVTGNQTADDGGGAYFTGADNVIEITGGSWTNNVAGTVGTGDDDNDGGGFSIAGTRGVITLDSVTLGGELAGGADASGLGTARGTGNFAEDEGGGFIMQGRNNTLNLIDTEIIGNQSNDDGGGFIVTNDSETVNITQTVAGGSVIRNNFSLTEDAGGFRSSGAVNITGSDVAPIEIRYNEVRQTDDEGGGFQATDNGQVTLTDVLIHNNVAGDRGGGFAAIGGSTVTLSSSVASTSGTASSFVSQIYENTVQNSGGDGGGFYVASNATTVNLMDVIIRDHAVDDEGAGFVSDSNGSVVNLTNVDIIDNIAQDNGGGFYSRSNGSMVSLDNVLIDNNRSATEHGGGFRNNGILIGSNVTISNNEAGDLAATNNVDRVGGGFYNNVGTVTLTDAVIENNGAYARGGGFFNSGGGVVTINSSDPSIFRSRIADNFTAQDRDGGGSRGSGGGFFVETAGSLVDLDDVDVTGNRAEDNGGGFFLQSDAARVELTNVTLDGNSADDEGGGFRNANGFSEVTLDNVRITNNSTDTIHGGGFRNAGQITGQDVVIDGNIAGTDDIAAGNNSNNVGGGFYSGGSSAVVDLTRVEITNNDAYGRGGGFYSDGASTVNLTDFIIRGNTTDQNTNESQGRGGGFWNSGAADVTLGRGEISDNESFGHGGGFFQQDNGSSVTLENVTISGNVAGIDQTDSGFENNRVGGGFYAVSQGTVSLDHVTITDNQVTRDGTDGGGGFRVDTTGNVVTLSNSIVYGNLRNVDATPVADDVDSRIGNGNLILGGNNIVGATTGNSLGGNAAGRLAVDPQLGTLQDNGGAILPSGSAAQTHLPGLPAIDAAAASSVTVDQRGVARPLGAAADLGATETRTFAITNKSGATDEDTAIPSLDLILNDGLLADYRDDFTAGGSVGDPADFRDANGFGWQLLWNAPADWDGTSSTDGTTGAIGTAATYQQLLWSGTGYTADGDNTSGNGAPANFLRLSGTGGHPGRGSSQPEGIGNDQDRYTIAAYTVDSSGDYRITDSFITNTNNSGGNGGDLRIYVNDTLVYSDTYGNGATLNFDTDFAGVNVGDTIYVAAGPNGNDGADGFDWDFSLQKDLTVNDAVALRGDVTLNPDGDTVIYDPNGQFEWLAEGDASSDTIYFGVRDASLGQNQPITFIEQGGIVVGDAANFSATSTANSGTVWLDATTSGNPDGLAGSRTGDFLQSLPNGGGLTGAVPDISPYVDYKVHISSAGTYDLLLRAAAADGGSDSIYASIVELQDGPGGDADWYRYTTPADSTFRWSNQGEFEGTSAGGNDVAPSFDLAAGTYTIRIMPREDGVALDAFALVRLGSLEPLSGTASGPAESAFVTGTVASATVTIDGRNDAPVAVDDPMVTIWQLGTQDTSSGEFGAPSGAPNAAPGNAATLDDDQYLAGTYPGPIGTVGDEAEVNFEGALTETDPVNRIHFTLDAAQAAADLQLVFGLSGSNVPTGAPIQVQFNRNTIYDAVVQGDYSVITPVFSGASVGAVQGENILTFSAIVASGESIDFDFVRLSETGGTHTTSEDAELAVSAQDGVLNNDVDPDRSGGLADDVLAVLDYDAVSANGAPVVVNADGSFSYDPRGIAVFDALAAGETLIDTFTYTVGDRGAPVAGSDFETNSTGGLDPFSSYVSDAQPVSFEAVFQPTDLSGREIIFETGGGNGVGLVLNGADLVFSVTQNSGGTQTAQVTYDLGVDGLGALPSPGNVSQAIHVIGTFDMSTNGTATLYVNGVEVGVSTAAANITDWTGGDPGGFGQGGGGNLGGFGDGFSHLGGAFGALNGTGSLLRIYGNQVLTQPEVTQNYVDSTGFTDTATVTVTVTGVNDAPTATDDYVDGQFEDTVFTSTGANSSGVVASDTILSNDGIVKGALLNYEANNNPDHASVGTTWQNNGTVGAATSDDDWNLGSGVTHGTTVSASHSGITHSYVFDGSTDADATMLADSPLDLGIDPTNDASIELWFRPDNLSGGNQNLFETGGGTGIGLVLQDNLLRFRDAGTGAQATYDLNNFAADFGVAANADFIQALGVYDITNGEIALYLNGQLVNSATAGVANWDGGDGAGLGYHGGDNQGGFGSGDQGFTDNFSGEMAIFRLYGGALSDSQAFQNFTAISDGTDIEGETISSIGLVDDMGSVVGAGQTVGVGTQITLVSGALVTLDDADGTFTYDPNGVFDGLVAGEVGTDTFTYVVADRPATATVTGLNLDGDYALLDLTIEDVNGDSHTFDADGLVGITVTQFDGNSGSVLFLPDGTTVAPAAGDRAAALDDDNRFDTSVANQQVGSTAQMDAGTNIGTTVQFVEVVTSALFFDMYNNADPINVQLSVDGINWTSAQTLNSYAVFDTNIPFEVFTSPTTPNTLTELENNAFNPNSGTTQDTAGLAINAADFGLATFQYLRFSSADSDTVDPVFIAGLPTGLDQAEVTVTVHGVDDAVDDAIAGGREDSATTIAASDLLANDNIGGPIQEPILEYDAAGQSGSTWTNTGSAGSAYDADLNGATVGAASSGQFITISEAYNFNGAGNGANDIADISLVTGDPTNDDATWEVVFRADPAGPARQLLFEAGGSGTGMYILYDRPTDSIIATIDGGDELATPIPVLQAQSGAIAADTDFRHVVVAYDKDSAAGDTLSIFVDSTLVALSSGVDTTSSDLDGTGLTNSGANVDDWSGGDLLGLGRVGNSLALDEGGITNPFQGQIARVALYEGAFDAGLVNAAYSKLTSSKITGVNGTSAGGATVVLNPDGSITYTPAVDQFDDLPFGETATDTFTYTIDDGSGRGTGSTATVTLTVRGENDPITAVDDTAETDEDTPVSVEAPGVLADNPLVFWKLGEADKSDGQTAVNLGALGAAGDGTYRDVVGNVSPGALPLGLGGDAAASFGATTSNVTDGDRVTVNLAGSMPTSALSVEMWVNIDPATAAAETTFVSYAESAAQNNELILISQGGTLQVWVNGSSVDTGIAEGTVMDNAWHHLALTYDDATNEAVVYVDGVGTTITHNGGAISSSGTLVIGQEQDAVDGGFVDSQKFVGAIDDFALFGSVLSQAQVDQHRAASPLNLLSNDTDVDIVNNPDGRIVISVDDSTTAPGNPVIIGSGAEVTVNIDGSYTYNPNGVWEFLAGGESVVDTFTYLAADTNALTVGLDGHWNFGETASGTLPPALDSSGNGLHGTLLGDASVVASDSPIGGDMVVFDGSDDGVEIGDVDLLEGGDGFTVSSWFKRDVDVASPTNHAVTNVLFAQSSDGSNDNFELGTSGDAIQLYMDTPGGDTTTNYTTGGIVDGDWYHIAVTYDAVAGTTTIFLNGTVVGTSGAYSGQLDSSGASPLTLGIARPTDESWGELNGAMDDAAIWSRVLTVDEISDLYQSAIDQGNSFQETAFANVDVTVNGVNDAPAVQGLSATDANENGSSTLTGTFTDPDLTDAHTLTVDWDDANNQADSIFTIASIGSGLAVNDDFTSTGTDSTTVLTITSVDASTGVVGFSVQHQYLDDGLAGTPFGSGGNGTTSDVSTISVTVADDDVTASPVTTTTTISNVLPTLTLTPLAAIGENQTTTLEGTLTDIGLTDSHQVVIEWDDPNNRAPSTFDLEAIFSVNTSDGTPTQELFVSDTFTSTTDGSTLTITAVDTTNGIITFTVDHLFLDDGVTYVEVGGSVVGEAINYSNRTTGGNGTRFERAGVGSDVSESIDESTSRTGDFLQILPEGGGGPTGSLPDVDPYLDYTIQISTAGTYQLSLRLASIDGASDSIYATIVEQQDGIGGTFDDWYRFTMPSGGEFNWRSVGAPESDSAGGGDVPATFDLAAGTYTLRIMQREDGAALDAWALTLDGGTIPSGSDPGPAATRGADGDTATISVTVTDDDSGEVSETVDQVIDNVVPVIHLNSVADIDENASATVTGTITDPGRIDHQVLTIDWGDPNDTREATFNLGAINQVDQGDGTLVQDLVGGETFNSLTDDSVLTISSVDAASGVITFSVERQYLDDGVSGTPFASGSNFTPSDTYQIEANVIDDDAPLVPAPDFDGDFVVSAFQVAGGGTDVNLNDVNEAGGIWDAIDAGAALPGNVSANGTDYNLGTLEQSTSSVVNYDPGGDFGSDLAYISIGAGSISGGNDFSVRAQTLIRFTTGGTYSIAAASDDGRRISLVEAAPGTAPGYTGFTAQGDQVDGGFVPGQTTVQFNGTTGHNQSVGVFTVAAGDVLLLDAFFFERSGGDHFELSIASGSVTTHNITDFVLLQDGVLGGAAELSSDVSAYSSDTTTVTVSNTDPTLVLAAGDIDENGSTTLSGTITDTGRADSLQVTIDWDDPNNAANSVFDLGALHSIDTTNGSLTQLIEVDDTFTSMGADTTTVLTITSVDTDSGAIGFEVDHQYVDDGLAPGNSTALDASTISVTVEDDDTGIVTEDVEVEVSNVAPVVQNLVVGAIDEQGTATLEGEFVDPGLVDVLEVTIDWDDANNAANSVFAVGTIGGLTVGDTFTSTGADTTTVLEITSLNLATGTVGFSVEHFYADDGLAGSPFSGANNATASDISTILVSVADDDTGIGSDTVDLTVSNLVPTIDLQGSFFIDEGVPLDFIAAYTDTGVEDAHEVVIDWGDLTPVSTFDVAAISTLTAGDTFASSTDAAVLTVTAVDAITGRVDFVVQHVYADQLIYTATLTVSDDDLGVVQDTTTVAVSNRPPFLDNVDSGTVLIHGVGAPPIQVAPWITVSDVPGDQMTRAVVRFASGYVPGEDLLFVRNGVPFGWTETFNVATGELILTAPAGGAPQVEMQQVLRRVHYANNNLTNPTGGVRNIQFQVFDELVGSNLRSVRIEQLAAPALPPQGGDGGDGSAGGRDDQDETGGGGSDRSDVLTGPGGVSLRGVLGLFRDLAQQQSQLFPDRIFAGFLPGGGLDFGIPSEADLDDGLGFGGFHNLVPYFAGVAPYGSYIEVVITDFAGAELGRAGTFADAAGNWSLALRDLALDGQVYQIEVRITPASWEAIPLQTLVGTLTPELVESALRYEFGSAGEIFGSILPVESLEAAFAALGVD